MCYTVASELELKVVTDSPHEVGGLPSFKSFDDAVEHVKRIQHLYLDHLNIYKMVPVATYRGKAV